MLFANLLLLNDVIVFSLNIAPPFAALFESNTELNVSEIVPLLYIAPPFMTALLFANTEFWNCKLPLLFTKPPFADLNPFTEFIIAPVVESTEPKRKSWSVLPAPTVIPP